MCHCNMLKNETICGFGHIMVGVIAALYCTVDPRISAICLFSFMGYEALEQFSGLKDDADEEIRQALIPFFAILAFRFATPFFSS